MGMVSISTASTASVSSAGGSDGGKSPTETLMPRHFSAVISRTSLLSVLRVWACLFWQQLETADFVEAALQQSV